MDHRSLVLEEDSEFEFECHQRLDCFKKCCRDISIYLTPYDVLRMKNFLGLTSGEFLKKYTLQYHVPQTGFSVVYIKMSEENDLRCPFITPKGCGVYMERPWSCRIAPVDMLGGGKFSFIFDSSRCHGLKEKKSQTIKEWMHDQGLEIYEEMEKGFKEIPNALKPTGNSETDEKISKFSFMICYDLDEFRDFLTGHPFILKKLMIDEKTLDGLKTDDVQLMKFGFALLSSGTDKLETLLKDVSL